MKNLLLVILLMLPSLCLAQPAPGSTVRIWDGTDIALVSAGKALLTDGSATTQPVSGTVTCNAGTNLNTSALATSAIQTTQSGYLDGIEGLLTTIDGDTGTLAGAVSGSEMQVDVLTLPAVTGTVTCNAGTDLNTSALATSAIQTTQSGYLDGIEGLLTTIDADTSVLVTTSTPYTFAALVDTVQTVKNSAGSLTGWYLFNGAATTCYMQIFDVSGAVTLGTTAPTLSFGIPAGSAANVAPGTAGITFANAIKVASTTTRAGAVPCTVGSDVNFWYK